MSVDFHYSPAAVWCLSCLSLDALTVDKTCRLAQPWRNEAVAHKGKLLSRPYPYRPFHVFLTVVVTRLSCGDIVETDMFSCRSGVEQCCSLVHHTIAAQEHVAHRSLPQLWRQRRMERDAVLAAAQHCTRLTFGIGGLALIHELLVRHAIVDKVLGFVSMVEIKTTAVARRVRDKVAVWRRPGVSDRSC